MNKWPLQKDCDGFYGNPRNPSNPALPSANWQSRNLVGAAPPYTMTYDGKPIRSIRIHILCAASLIRVLTAIWDAADRDPKTIKAWGADIFGGSYVYRQMRGLTTLSMHAYGCAIDLDPARNSLHDNTPHFTPDSAVVRAFRAEGWVWGGDWNGNGSSADERRCDGMHFQAARLS